MQTNSTCTAAAVMPLTAGAAPIYHRPAHWRLQIVRMLGNVPAHRAHKVSFLNRTFVQTTMFSCGLFVHNLYLEERSGCMAMHVWTWPDDVWEDNTYPNAGFHRTCCELVDKLSSDYAAILNRQASALGAAACPPPASFK